MAKIILLSGGMDSFISHRLFCPDYTPVFVHTGSRYAELDLRCAIRQTGEQLVQLHLPALHEREDGVVPHRNALLLAYVANVMEASTIAVSAPRGELIWDQQPSFHATMQRALRGVDIFNPLQHMTKAQAIKEYLQVYPEHVLRRTRSCYSATEFRCGQCAACVKRWIAMKYNGIEEKYTVHPYVHALELFQLATLGAVFRYGARPAFEAWSVLR